MTPTITTPRLILRAHTPADFDACCALWADPGVTRFISGRASTPDETWRRILAYVGHWQLLGYGYFLVTSRETGWAMLPQYQGRGLAREALTAVLAWADQTMPRTVCMIHPDNAPSLKLAQKLGYTEYARGQFGEYTPILLERLAG